MLAAGGCNGLSSSTCKVHCWEHRPLIEDVDNNDRFDVLCENGFAAVDPLTATEFFPPIPTAGFFLARACTETQSERETIKAAINAILAEEVLTATELSTYNSIVDEIADAGFDACVSHLIGDDPSTPITEFSDIDSTTPRGQSCVLPDAEDICDTYVRAVILDELGEVLGGGDEVPTYSIPGEKTLGRVRSATLFPSWAAETRTRVVLQPPVPRLEEIPERMLPPGLTRAGAGPVRGRLGRGATSRAS